MVVLITGAARGLGLCLTEKFAKMGWVVLATARNPETADKLNSLAKEFDTIHIMKMDVADWESVRECAKKVQQRFCCVDVIINNAGVLFESDKVKRIMDVDVDVLKNTMAVNVEGPILVLKAFYTLQKVCESPRFYLITSESTINGHWHGIPVYSLSKVAAGKAAGIIGASVEEKFQVLAIHPGRMDTDMGHATAQISPKEAAEGIYALAAGQEAESWYVDYQGKKMEA